MPKKQPLTNKFVYNFANFIYNRKVCENRFNLTVKGDICGKPPFVVLANHTSFNDVFAVARALKKFQPNYLCALDQIARNKAYYRYLGAIPKRQFVSEIGSVKACEYVLSQKRPLVIFPEGKLSVDGRTGIIPFSTAKLVKFLGAEVYAVKISGNYLGLPRWSKAQIKTEVEAEISKIFCKNELEALSADDIYKKITRALSYDEYKRQREKEIAVDRDLYGLENVLYLCPECGAEFFMRAEANKLICGKCGAEYEMNRFGVIGGVGGVPMWYELERAAVKKELISGAYRFEAEADIWELPDIRGYKYIGRGKVFADKNGLKAKAGGREIFFKPQSTQTLAFDAGKRFFISRQNNTYRFDCLNEKGVEITKLNLAAEENYKMHVKKNGSD